MQIDSGVSLRDLQHLRLCRRWRRRSCASAATPTCAASSTTPVLGLAPKFILGGGSNIILTRDMPQIVLKVEVMGMRLVEERADAWIVEAGAGESWHALVEYTLDHDLPGLENLALVPGSVGASPVQNIGAYGVELQDRFESLDAVDLVTGRSVVIDAAMCAFGYRDSVFKHAPRRAQPDHARALPLAEAPGSRCSAISNCRRRSPRPASSRRARDRWPTGSSPSVAPSCRIRRPSQRRQLLQEPVVTPEQCRDIIGRDP